MMSREYAGFTAGATGSVYAVELDGALKQECGIEPSEGDELRKKQAVSGPGARRGIRAEGGERRITSISRRNLRDPAMSVTRRDSAKSTGAISKVAAWL